MLRDLVGGIPTLERPRLERPGAATVPLDATLGAEGIPQSGTGQTALLTGLDAVARFGHHFGPWVPVSLRPTLEANSVLQRARASGRSAAFANAYPRGWPGPKGLRRVAAPPLAARAAGLLVRHAEALREGRAVASGIVNDGWIRELGHRDLPRVTPSQAGNTLATLAARHDLTLFAHYSTDLAGHRGGMKGAVAALERVDAFLGGLLEEMPDDLLLLVASDHGNIEDVTGGHTRNPALGLVVGPGAAEEAGGLSSITDVAPAILEWLGAC